MEVIQWLSQTLRRRVSKCDPLQAKKGDFPTGPREDTVRSDSPRETLLPGAVDCEVKAGGERSGLCW